MKKDMQPVANKNEIVVYQPEGGEFHIDVRVENETVWLNRQQMSILFNRDVKTIGKHIANALNDELRDIPTVANFATVQKEGLREVRRNVEHYNLDVVLSVGYRVKSTNGVKFRRWANQVLKEYMLKGYCINQRMLTPQAQQNLIENVDTRLIAVEQRVDFIVNTVHTTQNQKIEQLSNDVQKVMENFIDPTTYKHFLIFDGQKLEADIAYTKIYSMAKNSIIIIDNYIGVKTLDLLRGIAKNVNVHIFSEQWCDERITPAIKADFEKARPDVSLKIDRPNRKFHDRYMFLDYGLPSEKLFHCGASSKDGGNKVTTIMQIEHPEVYHTLMDSLTAAEV